MDKHVGVPVRTSTRCYPLHHNTRSLFSQFHQFLNAQFQVWLPSYILRTITAPKRDQATCEIESPPPITQESATTRCSFPSLLCTMSCRLPVFRQATLGTLACNCTFAPPELISSAIITAKFITSQRANPCIQGKACFLDASTLVLRHQLSAITVYTCPPINPLGCIIAHPCLRDFTWKLSKLLYTETRNSTF